MARRRKQRRQAHGSAWHWKQTDCWYYTLPGTRRRVGLFDEGGQRIRGLGNRQAAERALALAKLANAQQSGETIADQEWLVASVCSEYLQYCERSYAAGSMSLSHRQGAISYLNDLCGFCGALALSELKKGHIQEWVESHAGWHSDATRRSVLSIVLAAFNRAEQMFDVPNPLKGLKKPAGQPRLHSLSAEDEQAIYDATEPSFHDFLFAAIHTGLRPFCELATLKAEDVEETDRGMMWRVYSSKTKKLRKIPVQEEVARLTRQLLKTAPKGSGKPIFRNTKDHPWKRMTGVVRFLALKRKLGWQVDPTKRKYSCYSCRHTFAHRMLSGFWNGGVGCSIETLAELMGDTPATAFQHYGREWGQHYQAPLWAAIGATPTARTSTKKGRHFNKQKNRVGGDTKSATPAQKQKRNKARSVAVRV